MTVQHVQLDLPKAILRRLQQAADSMQRPLEDVIEQTIRGNLPPTLGDLPPAVQHEFGALQRADNQTLWRIAQESAPAEQWARHGELLARNQEGALSEAGKRELVELRDHTDRFVLRRSYALALLKWRGYAHPVL